MKVGVPIVSHVNTVNVNNMWIKLGSKVCGNTDGNEVWEVKDSNFNMVRGDIYYSSDNKYELLFFIWNKYTVGIIHKSNENITNVKINIKYYPTMFFLDGVPYWLYKLIDPDKRANVKIEDNAEIIDTMNESNNNITESITGFLVRNKNSKELLFCCVEPQWDDISKCWLSPFENVWWKIQSPSTLFSNVKPGDKPFPVEITIKNIDANKCITKDIYEAEIQRVIKNLQNTI